MVILTTNQVSRDQPNWLRPQWTLDIIHFWRSPHYNSIIQIFKQIFIVWTQVEVCRTNCFLFTLHLFTPKIMWKFELPKKSEVKFLIHFPCLKPRCRICTALCTFHNRASPPPSHFLNNLKFATPPCNENVFVRSSSLLFFYLSYHSSLYSSLNFILFVVAMRSSSKQVCEKQK